MKLDNQRRNANDPSRGGNKNRKGYLISCKKKTLTTQKKYDTGMTTPCRQVRSAVGTPALHKLMRNYIFIRKWKIRQEVPLHM